MKAESLSSLPRQNQASKFKSTQKEKTEKDELWAIANMSKEEAEEGNPFIRFPDCSTGNVFLADDRQLADLGHFVPTLSSLESWALTLSSTVVIFMLHQRPIRICCWWTRKQ